MKVVLDTNVIVSALLKSGSSSARILDLITSGQVTLLLDERILLEYREVLRRPKFQFDEPEVDELIALIDRIGEFIVAMPLDRKIPDPDDLPFLEVAVAGKADFLVTGNRKDFGKPPPDLRIGSPDEFWKNFPVLITRQ